MMAHQLEKPSGASLQKGIPPGGSPQCGDPPGANPAGGWHVRPYRAGDELAATALYSRVFGKSISPAHYCWKLTASPWAPAVPTVFFACSGERIVGQYAATAVPLWLEDREVLALHSCDTITDPEFRRRGILTTLASHAYQRWGEAGVSMVYGVPNQNWGSRAAHLGWQPLLPYRWLWKPLLPGRRMTGGSARLQPAAALVDGLFARVDQLCCRPARKAIAGIDVRRARGPEAAFNRLWERMRAAYPVSVVRNAAWIQYRYLSSPQQCYRVLLAHSAGEPRGYLIYRLDQLPGQCRAYLADLFCSPQDYAVCRALLWSALEELRAARATSVFALLPRRHPLLPALRRCGFLPRYSPFYLSAVPLRENAPLILLRNPRKFFSTGGDLDLV